MKKALNDLCVSDIINALFLFPYLVPKHLPFSYSWWTLNAIELIDSTGIRKKKQGKMHELGRDSPRIHFTNLRKNTVYVTVSLREPQVSPYKPLS